MDGPRVEIAGTGWIDVREIRLNAFVEPLDVLWTALKSWEVTVPLNPGANTIVLRAYDHQGREVGSDTIVVTNTGSLEPASSGNLVISEIHYNPVATQEDEFIEVMNIAPRTIDLTGVPASPMASSSRSRMARVWPRARDWSSANRSSLGRPVWPTAGSTCS